MNNLKIFLIIPLFLTSYQDCIGCTGIYCEKGNLIFFGNNEDHGDPNPYIWFQKPRPGKFGLIFYGFQDLTPQGGINEKGLSFDCFAQPYLAVTNSSHLPHAPSQPRNGEWLYQMLETCETVDEAISYLCQFNIYFFCTFQLFLADRFGNSVIVEGDSIIYKNGDFQVVTNFLHSHPELGNYPCWRYDTATQMLRSCDSLTVDYFKSILETSHTINTCYSNIHDPINGILYIYYMHQFQNVVMLNILEEIAKGDRIFTMSSLFAPTAVNYQNNDHLDTDIVFQNFPNPFNSETVIQFELSKSSKLTLNIYDHIGKLVLPMIEDHIYPAGKHEIKWDGIDRYGNKVASGVYMVMVNESDLRVSRRMLYIK